MYNDLIKRLQEDKPSRRMMLTAADAIEKLEHKVFILEGDREGLLAQIPRWIPVSERLPKNIDEEVLVCTEYYGVNGLGFVTVATYGESGWLECWERKTYLTAITHWMPLPEPPKEKPTCKDCQRECQWKMRRPSGSATANTTRTNMERS